MLEDELEDDDDTPLPPLEEEIQIVFVELLSDHKAQVFADPNPIKIVPIVEY